MNDLTMLYLSYFLAMINIKVLTFVLNEHILKEGL